MKFRAKIVLYDVANVTYCTTLAAGTLGLLNFVSSVSQ